MQFSALIKSFLKETSSQAMIVGICYMGSLDCISLALDLRQDTAGMIQQAHPSVLGFCFCGI